MSDQKYHQALTANRKLLAENARLKAEVERLDDLCKKLSAQHSDISCENIRLRKAGDEMDAFLGPCHASRQWRAAKEGRPNE